MFAAGAARLRSANSASTQFRSRQRMRMRRFLLASLFALLYLLVLAIFSTRIDWSTKGVRVPLIESVWQWLLDNRPEETGDVVLWDKSLPLVTTLRATGKWQEVYKKGDWVVLTRA